jgi:TRAF3-interacting protein 1
LGNLRKKKKNDKGDGEKIISATGELNEKELEMLQSMIQTICQNTAPLGKSIEFINDDVEAMNKELQFWRRQYNASKTKMQAEMKITEESLLPVYDKIAEIEDQIKDQKAKIQNSKAQIIKNDSIIKNLLMSVVTTK